MISLKNGNKMKSFALNLELGRPRPTADDIVLQGRVYRIRMHNGISYKTIIC